VKREAAGAGEAWFLASRVPDHWTEMNDARAKTGLDLSLVQVVAGTGAALTAALLGSLFGIAGTLLGTAVGSTVATICTALYTHQLRRTRDRLQRSASVPAGRLRPAVWRGLPWRRVLAAAGVVFGVAVAALTVFEAGLGRPLSSTTAGSPPGHGGSTSLGRALVAPEPRGHRPVPRRVDSPAPAVPPANSSPTATVGPGAAATADTRPDGPPPPAGRSPKQGAPTTGPGAVSSTAPSDSSDPQPSAPSPSDPPASEPPLPPSGDPATTDQPTPPPPTVQP
jgi:hypothetical protein